MLVKQCQFVIVATEGVLGEIGCEQRNVLARALGLRVRREVVAFGGEAHAEQGAGFSARRLRDRGEDVGVLGECEIGKLTSIPPATK